MQVKSYNTWKFEELDEEQQETILENYCYFNVEDSFWYDYEGKTGFTAKKLQRMKTTVKNTPCDLLTYKNLYFDLDRSWFIQFTDCHFTDNETARKFLRVPSNLWERVYWSFDNSRENTTRLEYEWEGDKDLTKRQEEILNRAIEIFSDKMDEALKDLRNSYEYLLTDEVVKESLIINDYDFDESGKIA